ncbi:MAG: hypothetical protein Q7V63_09100 [Gammaproteobacteria bacterium]|nr:hypothetical protein [Gammaproteobacteria bacterium]
MKNKIRVESFSLEMCEPASAGHGFHERNLEHLMLGMAEKEVLAHSEHLRALYIARHPEMLIMQEGLSHELNTKAWLGHERSLLESAQDLFRDGMPIDFHALNKEQKDFLVNHGAAKTMLYMGRIKCVYPLITGDKEFEHAQINKLAEKQASEVAIALFYARLPCTSDKTDVSALGNKILSMAHFNVIGDVIRQSNYDASDRLAHGSLRSPMSKPESTGLAGATLAISFGLVALVIGKCCRRRAHHQVGSSHER